MAIQDIVLDGFGSTGSVSLIITSGFQAGAAIPPVVSVPETFSGGWEHHPYRYRARKRLRFPWEEEEKKIVQPILEDLVERFIEQAEDRVLEKSLRALERDLEIALRLRLAQKEHIFKAMYMQILNQLVMEELKIREEEELVVRLLLH